MSKERPILFSGSMVRALLADAKTQTRRAMKPQMIYGPVANLFNSWYWPTSKTGGTLWPNGKDRILSMCPYGQPGDRLWVRETFVQGWDYDPVTDRIKQFDANGKQLPIQTWYRADGADIGWCDADGWQANTPWKPSIHMPRAVSRITLEITGVRVERLQAITRGDAMSEGCPFPNMAEGDDPRKWYADLWNEINGPGGWDANPWVWVLEFKRLP